MADGSRCGCGVQLRCPYITGRCIHDISSQYGHQHRTTSTTCCTRIDVVNNAIRPTTSLTVMEYFLKAIDKKKKKLVRVIRLWSVCPLTNLLWFLYQTVECGSSILSEWFFISRVLSLPWPTVTGLHRSLDRLRPALLSHWTDCTWLCYDLLYWDERPSVVWWPMTCRIVLSPMVSHITFIIVLSLNPMLCDILFPMQCAVCCGRLIAIYFIILWCIRWCPVTYFTSCSGETGICFMRGLFIKKKSFWWENV